MLFYCFFVIVEVWAQTQIFTVVFSRLGNEWILIMIIKKEENLVRKKRRRKPIWFKFVHIALGSVNFCCMMKLRICLWSKWAVKAGFEVNKSNTFHLFLPDQARFHRRGTYCSHPFLQLFAYSIRSLQSSKTAKWKKSPWCGSWELISF